MKIKYSFIVIFAFTAIFIFANCFLNYDNLFYTSMIHIGESESSVKAVFSTDIKSKEEIYEILTVVMKKYSANIYCSNIDNIKGKDYYVKNIYVTNFSTFQEIKLDSGRFYNANEINSDYFLSTDRTNNSNQIGVVSALNKNKGFMVKTLRQYFSDNNAPLDKTYVIELNDHSDLNDIKKELKQEGIVLSYQSNDFKNAKQPSYYVAVTMASTLILVFLIMYDFIRSYKKIGIKKMLGYDFNTIWSESVPKLVICQSVVFAITALIFTSILVPGFNFACVGFLKKLFFCYLAVTIVTLIIISLPFIFVKYVSLSGVIKNQRPYRSLIVFNSFLKFISFTSAICVMCLSISDLNSLYTLSLDKYSNWNKTKQFAYVSVMEIPNESDWTGETDEDIENFKEIYKIMNANGSVYADFSIYSPLYDEDRENGEFPVNISVNVNPNYLKLFPVYDKNNQKIVISENEKSCVVLAPEKYKNKEDKIQEYYSEYGFTGKAKVIWYKDSQSLFTFALDCGDIKNTVKDPVINVLTENNGDPIDYSMILGETGGPFKIKVNDFENATAEIAKVCSKFYDESEVRFPATGVYQAIEEQVKELNTKLIVQFLMFVALIIICFSAVIQNVIAYMEQHQKELAVKKIMGFRFKERYINYYVGMVFLDASSFIVALLIDRNFIETVLISAILISIDVIFSTLYIKKKDRIDIINVAKGG